MKIPRPSKPFIVGNLYDPDTQRYCAVGWLGHIAGVPDSVLTKQGAIDELPLEAQYSFHDTFPRVLPEGEEYGDTQYSHNIVESIYDVNDGPGKFDSEQGSIVYEPVTDEERFARVAAELEKYNIEFSE